MEGSQILEHRKSRKVKIFFFLYFFFLDEFDYYYDFDDKMFVPENYPILTEKFKKFYSNKKKQQQQLNKNSDAYGRMYSDIFYGIICIHIL